MTIRRLNRFEYNNTIRDLFDFGDVGGIRPAEAFPADGAGKLAGLDDPAFAGTAEA